MLVITASSLLAQKPEGLASWTCRWRAVGVDEVVVSWEVRLAPGWHIYSHYLQAGGPQPTKFVFEKRLGAEPVGGLVEDGVGMVYYDSIYEMEIIKYASRVEFSQRFRLHQAEAVVAGEVSFMICDNGMCVPGRYPFVVPLRRHRTP
jgi:DsbC/DsbD-like thiol-disulfide interchange protein